MFVHLVSFIIASYFLLIDDYWRVSGASGLNEALRMLEYGKRRKSEFELVLLLDWLFRVQCLWLDLLLLSWRGRVIIFRVLFRGQSRLGFCVRRCIPHQGLSCFPSGDGAHRSFATVRSRSKGVMEANGQDIPGPDVSACFATITYQICRRSLTLLPLESILDVPRCVVDRKTFARAVW